MLKIVLAALICMFAVPAMAQDSSSSAQIVAEYNKIKPLQNPDYKDTDDIFNRKILDGKNRVIGEVQDVVIARNGSIESLKASFDRLQLATPVFLNYRSLDIRPAGRGYALRVSDDQIADLYPTLLAEIQTASGAEDENLSVQKLIGADIFSNDGRAIGIIEDVLFAADGGRAEAIYVGMTFGTLRGRAVAIPLKSAAFGNNGQKMTALIANELADAMISYASQK
jgi:sporulation protein YlmC with PRC-barrel domain